MIRRQKDRRDIDYVKPYKNSEHARKDLEGMKDAFKYYKNKKETLKKELQENGLWTCMPKDYRYEMYALRTMLGILDVKITKCTAAYKKLQREESWEQRRQQIRKKVMEDTKRRKEEENKLLEAYEEEVTKQIEYYSTEEGRKKIMSKVLDAANIIHKQTKKKN